MKLLVETGHISHSSPLPLSSFPALPDRLYPDVREERGEPG